MVIPPDKNRLAHIKHGNACGPVVPTRRITAINTTAVEWGSFENFLRDMGLRPLNTSLDRVNNNEGYEMDNCRWATPKVQRNNRGQNKNRQGGK